MSLFNIQVFIYSYTGWISGKKGKHFVLKKNKKHIGSFLLHVTMDKLNQYLTNTN